MARLALHVLSALALLAACSSPAPHSAPPIGPPLFCPPGDDLAALVDPFLGTGNGGNAVPGALVPYGMVKVSPDSPTVAAASYQYSSDTIAGISHTHLEGPGGSGYGYSQIRVLPGTGALTSASDAHGWKFSHDTEQASPGYYAVTLADVHTRVELTATAQAALHRYRFPSTDDAWVLLDSGSSQGDSLDGAIEVVDHRTVRGFGTYDVEPMLDVFPHRKRPRGRVTVYFHAVFDRPFHTAQTWGSDGQLARARQQHGPDLGAVLHFDATTRREVVLRVGISLVSENQAKLNLEQQVGRASFEEVRAEARRKWNCYLNRVAVEGGSPEQRKIFYTSLYHSFMQPADYSETGGIFAENGNGDGATVTWTDKHFFTDDWCAWDTFRTAAPLRTLLDPVTAGDVAASYLQLYEEGGWLPKCSWNAGGYSRGMIGNHAISNLADAIAKGIPGVDLDRAWEAVHHSTESGADYDLFPGLCGYMGIGTAPEYRDMGFVSHQCDRSQSASMTLEHAYDDWCAAQVADKAGHPADAAALRQRSQNYRNQWDASVGFMRGKNRDGSWVDPFDPSTYGFTPADAGFDNDFTEASAWVYTFFVPHDIPGLVDLMGGPAGFEAKLDQMIGGHHLAIGNEPSFQVPYLYNFVGRPAKTEALVRHVLSASFAEGPSGLPGNDDSGATSAWYVFGAIGLYPVTPGNDEYQVVSPIFTRVTVHLDPAVYDAGQFVIEAPDSSAANAYIQAASLDGMPLQRTHVTHAELVGGATLHLDLGPNPGPWQQRP